MIKLTAMPTRTQSVRIWLIVGYFAVSFGTLYVYAYHNYFCARQGSQSYALIIARLALACTIWDSFADFSGSLALSVTKKQMDWQGTAILVSTLVAGIGFASMPFWIYRGYGRFLFENTWADVSCVFTEGYGMLFPFIVAPILSAATLVRELIALKAHG